MNGPARMVYQALSLSIRAYQRCFLDFHVWGREHIPKGAKIYAGNHFTTWDSFYVMPVLPEPVHFVLGPGFRSALVARMLNAMEQVNAMPDHHGDVVRQAAVFLERGEAVMIAPEGDLNEPLQMGRFQPGIARIFRRHPAPIIPMVGLAPKRAMKENPRHAVTIGNRVYRSVKVTRGTYCINIGKPFYPELPPGSDARKDIALLNGLRERMIALVEDIRMNKFWLS